LRDRAVLRFLWWGHRFWYRVSAGRIGAKVRNLPVLELTTAGRRSGERRSVLLNHVSHSRGFVVVASNAGSDRPPAWWLNLEADPRAEVRVRGLGTQVRAEIVEGTERHELWSRFVAANPDYAAYERATSRSIPVVLLAREP
jgi:deazaflavin-dependent oxidoreductase (nitroreductase family)